MENRILWKRFVEKNYLYKSNKSIIIFYKHSGQDLQEMIYHHNILFEIIWEILHTLLFANFSSLLYINNE